MKLTFEESYMGQLRKIIGKRIVLVPAARVILENAAGEILLVKRSDDGFWGCPAGLPEVGESILDCARREVLEETGLVVNSLESFGFSSNPDVEQHRYPNGDRTQAFALLLYCKDFSGTPVLSDETTDVRFFKNLPPEAEILRNERPTFLAFQEWKKSRVFQCI